MLFYFLLSIGIFLVVKVIGSRATANGAASSNAALKGWSVALLIWLCIAGYGVLKNDFQKWLRQSAMTKPPATMPLLTPAKPAVAPTPAPSAAPAPTAPPPAPAKPDELDKLNSQLDQLLKK